jgi:dienelactone hydrolase
MMRIAIRSAQFTLCRHLQTRGSARLYWQPLSETLFLRVAAAGFIATACAAALVGSGPYALVPDTDTLHAIFGAPYTPSDWQPVHFADRTAPQRLLLHGADDEVVYRAHTEKLRNALLAQGAEVESHLYPGRGHADTIASFALVARYRSPALKQSLAFLAHIANASVRPAAAK